MRTKLCRVWLLGALTLALSGCGGGGGSSGSSGGDGGYGGSPPPPPPPPPAPIGNLQLQSSTWRVTEGTGTANLVVTRIDGTRGAVGVTLTTTAGSANAGADFTTTSTTVTFADGDAATKTVPIPVLDDGTDEPDETFTVALSAATGGATLGGVTSATITIVDDDDADILTHRVAGTVSGLTGAVALRNNNVDELRVESNGAFTFPVQVAEGQPYAVTVATQPTGQDCTASHASGTMGTTDVIDVAVTCTGGTPPPPPQPTTGVFNGGPVRGLHYRTPSHSGLTDEAGTFIYIPGERVAFSIGGIELGSALGAPQINLFTLLGLAPPATEFALRAEINSQSDITDFDRVANQAHFLFALDADHNGANGIDLGDWDTRLADATLNFEVPRVKFASDEFARFAGLHGVVFKFSLELPLVNLYRSLGISVAVHVARTRIDNQSGDKQFFEFDAEGRVARLVNEHDTNHDGIADGARTTTTYRYDAVGNLDSQVEETGAGSNGSVDTRSTTTKTYDAAGNLVSEVREDDNVLGGAPEERYTTTYTYDAVGNVVLLAQEDDFNADGTPESGFISTNTFTYDVAGRVLSGMTKTDNGADGSINRVNLETAVYDAAGRLQSATSAADTDADGALNRKTLIFNAYDAAGSLVTRRTEYDDVGGAVDGTIDRAETSVFVPGPVGNLSSITERDDQVDGTVDFRRTGTIVYGSVRDFLSSQLEDDNNGDGVPDSEVILSREYGVDGNLLSAKTRTNGTVTSDIEFSSATLPDGVGYLLKRRVAVER